MRMDRDSKVFSTDVVNTSFYNDLVKIIRRYGEEKYASSNFQSNIIKTRK